MIKGTLAALLALLILTSGLAWGGDLFEPGPLPVIRNTDNDTEMDRLRDNQYRLDQKLEDLKSQQDEIRQQQIEIDDRQFEHDTNPPLPFPW